MAWNPAPEVAVARDAAKKLGAHIAIVLYVMPDGNIRGASFGKTMKLCAEAGAVMDRIFEWIDHDKLGSSPPKGGASVEAADV